MTTRDYLLQLRTIDMDIEIRESEAQSWRDLAAKMHHEPSDINIKVSPSQDKFENLVIKAADCAMKADRERDCLLYTKRKIEDQIKCMTDKTNRWFVWVYYHDGRSLGSIGKEKNYTRQHVSTLLRKAEKDFEKLYGDTYI